MSPLQTKLNVSVACLVSHLGKVAHVICFSDVPQSLVFQNVIHIDEMKGFRFLLLLTLFSASVQYPHDDLYFFPVSFLYFSFSYVSPIPLFFQEHSFLKKATQLASEKSSSQPEEKAYRKASASLITKKKNDDVKTESKKRSPLTKDDP